MNAVLIVVPVFALIAADYVAVALSWHNSAGVRAGIQIPKYHLDISKKEQKQ